jgi:hypothetical protein
MIMSLAKRAYSLFKSSEPMEKRAFLNFLLQNSKLQGKNLTFELKTPFNRVLEANKCSNLLRAVRELRTIILSGWKSYELDAAVDMMDGKLPLNY